MTEFDITGKHWSILIKTEGGVVSILRELTLEECRQTWERLDPWYGHTSVVETYTDEEGNIFCSGGSAKMSSDNDVEIREVFGPPGWDREKEMRDWERWPKTVRVERKKKEES